MKRIVNLFDYISFSSKFENSIIILSILYLAIPLNHVVSKVLNFNSGNMPVNALLLSLAIMVTQLRFCFFVKDALLIGKRFLATFSLACIIISFPSFVKISYSLYNSKNLKTVCKKGDILDMSKGTYYRYYLRYKVDGFEKSIRIDGKLHTELYTNGISNYCVFLRLKYTKEKIIFIDSYYIDRSYKDFDNDDINEGNVDITSINNGNFQLKTTGDKKNRPNISYGSKKEN